MIAPFVSAVLVSVAGVACTAGILAGVLSLFEKYLKPDNKNGSAGTGAGVSEAASRGDDYIVLGG